jgi:hypothetical protein
LARMARQYLTVPATSASPERFFSRVGLVQTDLLLLDTTMIDLMWAKHRVSHTNTLEVLLNLPHHIPDPTLPTINLVDKRSLLITRNPA